MKIEFSGQSLENYSNIKFHEIKLEPKFPCGPTDGQTPYRHDEANSSLFSQFCERA
jgi:hypothetical protein